MHRTALSHYFGHAIDAEWICLNPSSTIVQTWHAIVGMQQFCVRVFAASHKTRMTHELQCAQFAAQRNFAPSILWVDQETGVYITEWLPGRHANYLDEHDRTRVLITLKEFHEQASTILLPCTPILNRIRSYLGATIPAHYHEFLTQCEKRSAEIVPIKTTLIHNDLHAENMLLLDESIKFIDWSEAGIGDIGNDLAEILMFVPQERHLEIAELYFEMPPTKKIMQSLTQHWHLRIALFAAWGVHQAHLRDPMMLTKPIILDDTWEFSREPATLLRSIVQGERVMQTAHDYYCFSDLLRVFFQEINRAENS